MTALLEPASAPRYTIERYFALVDEGLLGADDRVELLEGVVVAMSPRNPPHDAAVSLAATALTVAVADRASVRCQLSLVLGQHSVPEPDVAVVSGHARDYGRAHPRTALLVVEVADTSLAQDRITKAAIYAAAGIPECWIVNLRDGCVEVHRAPDREAGRYTEARTARAGEGLDLAALPGVSLPADDLLLDLSR